MTRIPDYLAEPSLSGHLYGQMDYSNKGDKDSFYLAGEPAMRELAKRLFPGAVTYHREIVRFRATRRAVGDLNWFLLRYPLELTDNAKEKIAEVMPAAIEHALRRERNTKLELATTPPTFLAQLYDYQREGAAFMIANERALLADGTGTGKTFTALGAAATVNRYPILCVVQPHVQFQWRRVIGALFDLPGEYQLDIEDDQFTVADKRGESLVHICAGLKPSALPDKPFVICHYSILRAWGERLLEYGFPTLIYDEVQELRHTGTAKYSEASKLSSAADNVWGLSGTPIFGYGSEIWAVLNAIDFHCLSDYEAFTREWCTGYGEKIVKEPSVLNDHLRREGLMIRRRLHEVEAQMPKSLRKVQPVEKDDDVYSEAIGVAVELANQYDRTNEFHTRGKMAREIEQRTRRATGVSKAGYVAHFVRALLEAGEKVMLFAWHHDVHNILTEHLSEFEPAVLTGRQTTKQKDGALRRFVRGETNLAQLSLRSAAGLDGLQHRATCGVFAELDWSPAVHTQCEARLARIGYNPDLTEFPFWYCVTDAGFDEVMLDVLGLKTAQFVGIMDDEPESEEERQLAEQAADNRIRRIVEKLKHEERSKCPRWYCGIDR